MGKQPPTMVRRSGLAATTSATNRDLPIPASPTNSVTPTSGAVRWASTCGELAVPSDHPSRHAAHRSTGSPIGQAGCEP